MRLESHYAGDRCPHCGSAVRRWRTRDVHYWLEIWWCEICHLFIECDCRTCGLLKAMARG